MHTYKVLVKDVSCEGQYIFSSWREELNEPAIRIGWGAITNMKDGYTEWQVADFNSPQNNLSVTFINEYVYQHSNIYGTISNIQPLDGIALFEIFRHHGKPLLQFIPRALKTVGFVAYIRANYPELYVDRATVMWGSQFNVLYPGKKKRVFAETRYHNGHMWEEGLNLCNDYNPNIDCGNGLYFVEAYDINKWLTYRWGITLKSTVYIPDDALVTVIISNVSGEIKFKTDKIVVKKFKQI